MNFSFETKIFLAFLINHLEEKSFTMDEGGMGDGQTIDAIKKRIAIVT